MSNFNKVFYFYKGCAPKCSLLCLMNNHANHKPISIVVINDNIVIPLTFLPTLNIWQLNESLVSIRMMHMSKPEVLQWENMSLPLWSIYRQNVIHRPISNEVMKYMVGAPLVFLIFPIHKPIWFLSLSTLNLL